MNFIKVKTFLTWFVKKPFLNLTLDIPFGSLDSSAVYFKYKFEGIFLGIEIHNNLPGHQVDGCQLSKNF